MSHHSAKIAELTDLLRTTFPRGKVVFTEGIRSLADDVRSDVISKVRTFDAFTQDNDPYGEHDFGAFEHDIAGRVFWKIDYYDRDCRYGSDDPANPEITTRVLTVMLADEY